PLLVRRNSSVRVTDPKNPKAVSATTHFRALSTRAETTLVEAQLATGRMHQIRVHAAHLGHPVVGDVRYGDRSARVEDDGVIAQPLHLHAHRLAFEHPITKAPLQLEAELPGWASAASEAPPS
ncbi:MAG: pseudouridine synthase, partial [Nannocystaceae bacterium]